MFLLSVNFSSNNFSHFGSKRFRKLVNTFSYSEVSKYFFLLRSKRLRKLQSTVYLFYFLREPNIWMTQSIMHWHIQILHLICPNTFNNSFFTLKHEASFIKTETTRAAKMGNTAARNHSDETKEGCISKNWCEFCCFAFLYLQDTAIHVKSF